EILELRRRIGEEAAVVVEDEGLAAPVGLPVLIGVEVEDMRSELAAGIAVGRDRTTVRRIMPVQDDPQRPAAEHALEEAAIGRAAEFVDKVPPGLRQR